MVPGAVAVIGEDGLVKYTTAVARLRSCADDLDRIAQIDHDRLLVDAWVFGELLEAPDQLDVISLALVVDLPVEEVTWEARPALGEAMTSFLRFDKYPVQWWWRPSAWPVWNHAIDRAVRFWSHDGPDTAALDALAAQHHDGLQMIRPSHTEVLRAQLLVEHEAARQHLQDVIDQYADRDWRGNTAATVSTLMSQFEPLLDNDVLAPHVCRSAGKTPRPGAADIDES